MKLSEHFTLEEMTASQTAVRHGIVNQPTIIVLANLKRLAFFMEDVRMVLCRPVIVTSALRVLEVNRLVGSKDTSDHIVGCAIDFKVHDLMPDEIIQMIIDADIPFNQLIREFDSWVHLSVPRAENLPWRREILIIDSKGTRPWHSQS